MFWGVREIKRRNLFSVRRPYVEAEIGHTLALVQQYGRPDKVDKIKTRPCNNAKINPNFPFEAFVVDVVRMSNPSLFFIILEISN